MESVEKPRRKAKMQLNLEHQKRSGEMVVETVGISKSFNDHFCVYYLMLARVF